MPNSLFARALWAGKEDKWILEQQRADKDTFEEWKGYYQCEEQDGALYRKGALAVMPEGEVYRDLLKRYHDGTTAGHPGV